MTASLAEYRLADLDVGAPLGEGGAAEIHRCKTPDGRPMVFKRYLDVALEHLDADTLRHVIAWPAQLPEDDRDRLLRLCAWPQATVTDGGAVIGLLMDEAPTKFFFRRGDNLMPRHLTFVAVTKERAERRNWPYYDFPHKIARFGHLLEALQFLHSYKIVVGDLQPNNILTTSPELDSTGRVTTEIFLLDCDSFIVDGRAALPPMDPQNMRPPYEVDGHSATTDLYKVAKLMIRCLSEDFKADAIHYDKFSNVLPSKDFKLLEKLLTEKDPGLTADVLGNLGHAWQATVRPKGKLVARTNRSLVEPWTEELRKAHLAGLEPPKVLQERGKGKDHTPADGEEGTGGQNSSGKPKQRRWLVAAVLVVILAAIIIAAVLANKQGSSNSSGYSTSTSSTWTQTATYSSATTYEPSTQSYAGPSTGTDSAAVDSVMRSAQPGECLHREDGGPDSVGGTVIARLYVVGCGSSAATSRVVSTHTVNGTWAYASVCGAHWLGTDSYPYVVLCTTTP
jgi:hypothetical protein